MRVGTRDDLETDLDTRADIAVRGVRMDAPVRRSKGAGPSDDGHLVVDGANAALPLNDTSPYSVRDGRIFRGPLDLGLSVEPVSRPKFYDMSTKDGVPYRKIALLHGKDVLASTVVQTCIRYGEDQRCRFGLSLHGAREEDLIEGVIPTHPLDVQDALIHYARKGAIINSTYQL